MEPGSLFHLPKRVRVLVFVVLAVGLALSGALLIYGMLAGLGTNQAFTAGVSLLQLALTGFALALVAFYSNKTVSTNTLLIKTTEFLTKELPQSFKSTFVDVSFDETQWKSLPKNVNTATSAAIQVAHIHGTVSSMYRIDWHGHAIKMFLQLNAFRFVAIYYFPKTDINTIEFITRALTTTIQGAVSADYKYRLDENTQQDDTGRRYVELYFYKTVSTDLLMDTSARAYWAHDIAAMTRSAMLQCMRYKITTSETGTARA